MPEFTPPNQQCQTEAIYAAYTINRNQQLEFRQSEAQTVGATFPPVVSDS